MSFQAVAWAMKQELPPLPKFILVALCERANPDTGECWPGIKTVAQAVCLSERSVVTYISALVRNGFVDRQAMRGKDGRKRTNHYWILFDRIAAPWVGPGGKVEEIIPSEADEEEAAAASTETESPPHANPAPGHHAQTDSHGPHAPACAKHIEPEPPVKEPSESEILDRAARKPVPPAAPPQGFDPNARQREQQRLKAADEARKPKRYPVIRGTPAWNAWVAHGHSDSLHANIVMPDGRRDRGWMFPTLWPPRKAEATGPPEAAE